ncbi:MAG TPA: hypothetical protein VFH95_03915 [Candidatus Kapabacteria bacterium]|nr:hypothetical protein [Candidatus Kapabacteria bacterium]
MKKVILLVLAIALASCAGSHQQVSYGGHTQPIVAWDSLNTTNPCQDSLFLALENKPASQLTAFEQAYFQQKWDECNGTPEVNHGSTPEWILATIDIIGFFAAVIILGAG